MKFDVEKFKKLARPMTEAERQEIKFRDENHDWLSLSSKFALSVRHILRTEGITQRELAARMNVSPAQITKILSGKENLSLQTIAKVEKALGRNVVNIMESKENENEDLESPIYTGVYQYEIPNPTIDYACEPFDDTSNFV